jgi:hypothetical protein
VGTYFLGAGQTGKLNFGARSSSWMVGGDYQTTWPAMSAQTRWCPMKRASAFGRASYDLTSNIEIFAQFGWNRYIGESYYQQTPSTGVTIRATMPISNRCIRRLRRHWAPRPATRSRSAPAMPAFRCPAATTRATSIAMSRAPGQV